MSSDLLAEFDSFYRAPQTSAQSGTTIATSSNDLSFLSNTNGNGSSQPVQTGNFQQCQNPPATSSGDIWGNMTSFQAKAQPAAQDDIWGSFEAADTRQTQPQRPAVSTPTFGGTPPNAALGQASFKKKTGIVRRPTLDLFSSNIDIPEAYVNKNNTTTDPAPPQRPPAVTKSSLGEVLFDADDVTVETEDDDDFGEFESVAPEPIPQAKPSQSLNAMLGATSLESKPSKRPATLHSTSSNMNGMLPYPQAPKSPSFQERNPFADLALATKPVINLQKEEKPRSASPVTAWPSFEPEKPNPYKDSPAPNNQLDDDWGDFADLPPETPAVQAAKASSGIEADAWGWDTADQIADSPPAEVNVSPPTNIPPPSVLLALFPSIFDLPQTALFKPVANQSFSLKNRIMSDPSTIEFLRAYLLIATVAAHIIAGRKLRWKRDTLLSQAMKIGQAAAGGKSGMKLTGVDKAETAREEREAAEVVRVWKDQLGRLRSAIAVANSSIQNTAQHLAIPDVSESMHIRTQERALAAPKSCLICGLKREERVNKVDIDVEDSFGEWWVDHWGHRACRNFWLENEAKLRNR